MKIRACVMAMGLCMAGAGVAGADTAAQPINCSTAEGDIRALNSEKKHAQDQKLRNVASITPAGALLGIVTGTEGKRLEMLTGDYEKQIDARIDAIQTKCGITPKG
ncbi:MAG: hypothetical protein OIF47_07395 [Marinibacterium sp.]|nr:hypothetical protein [Marinibacterium sp.]